MVPYQYVKERIAGFSKFDKYIKTSPKGTVYLNKRANAIEAMNYSLVPLDNTVADMVSDSLTVIGDDVAKVKLRSDLEKAIEEDKNDAQLGFIVQSYLANKVLSPKNIFGYGGDKVSFMGGVFRAYMKGEVDLPEIGEEENEDNQEQGPPKRELNIDSAQDYMILFRHLINN